MLVTDDYTHCCCLSLQESTSKGDKSKAIISWTAISSTDVNKTITHTTILLFCCQYQVTWCWEEDCCPTPCDWLQAPSWHGTTFWAEDGFPMSSDALPWRPSAASIAGRHSAVSWAHSCLPVMARKGKEAELSFPQLSVFASKLTTTKRGQCFPSTSPCFPSDNIPEWVNINERVN